MAVGDERAHAERRCLCECRHETLLRVLGLSGGIEHLCKQALCGRFIASHTEHPRDRDGFFCTVLSFCRVASECASLSKEPNGERIPYVLLRRANVRSGIVQQLETPRGVTGRDIDDAEAALDPGRHEPEFPL